MSNLKDIQQIQSLIAKGKGTGFLTFEEVNKALPVEMSTPEQFEEIIGIFEQLEIVIVDSEKDGKKISATAAETDDDVSEDTLDLTEDEESADYSSRSTDPVRMYLREMGAVPLLDRDGEVVIAKKIEMGEQDVLYALVEVPVAVEELINVGEDLKLNRIKLKDVVKTIEEDDPTEDEMNQRTRVILLLEEIRQTFKKKRKIYAKLDECCTLERRVTARRKSWRSRKRSSRACVTSNWKRRSSTGSSRRWRTTSARCATASATCRPTCFPPARIRRRSRICSASSTRATSAPWPRPRN